MSWIGPEENIKLFNTIASHFGCMFALTYLEGFVSFLARLKGFFWICRLSCLRILEVLWVWDVLGGFVVGSSKLLMFAAGGTLPCFA